MSAILLWLLVVGRSLLPQTPGHLGSLVDSFAPWSLAAAAALVLLAALRRSATAGIAVLVLCATWLMLFAGALTDKREAGHRDLTVVSHNVSERNPDPVATARDLAATHADVIALEEMGIAAVPRYERALHGSYPFHTVAGGVGLFSRYPLRAAEPVRIMAWPRALRATVETPRGPVAVFVAHLASVRAGADGFATGRRDAAARLLAASVHRDPTRRKILLGDFNGATGDRGLAPVTGGFRSVQDTSGKGFGFTWPSRFPLVRIDNILVRGVHPLSAWTLPATTSDHLPVAAAVRW